MRRLWMFHRRWTVVAVLTVLALVAGLMIGLGGSGGHRGASNATATRRPAERNRPGATGATAQAPDRSYHPSYLPARSGVPSPLPASQVAALEGLRPPSPAFPPSLPAVPTADRRDAVDWSMAFTRELLDIDFARESRAALARWADGEAAAFAMQGVPLVAARNSLYASLFDPTAIGGTVAGDPVPTQPRWNADARSQVEWHVSRLWATESRSWEKAVASGRSESRDPLMTEYDVTGTLTITRPRRRKAVERFKLDVEIGSALHHRGYGTLAVSWTVT